MEEEGGVEWRSGGIYILEAVATRGVGRGGVAICIPYLKRYIYKYTTTTIHHGFPGVHGRQRKPPRRKMEIGNEI